MLEPGNVIPVITGEDYDVPLLDFSDQDDGKNENGLQGNYIEIPQVCEKQDDEANEILQDVQEDNLVRRSERLRRAPGRFHYPQLGKPLISFAQNLLESFNHALNSFNDYESQEVIQI